MFVDFCFLMICKKRSRIKCTTLGIKCTKSADQVYDVGDQVYEVVDNCKILKTLILSRICCYNKKSRGSSVRSQVIIVHISTKQKDFTDQLYELTDPESAKLADFRGWGGDASGSSVRSQVIIVHFESK